MGELTTTNVCLNLKPVSLARTWRPLTRARAQSKSVPAQSSAALPPGSASPTWLFVTAAVTARTAATRPTVRQSAETQSSGVQTASACPLGES